MSENNKIKEKLKTIGALLTGLQSAVFQKLLHDVHGKSFVNDAKKNRNDHAIITL